VIKSYAGKIPLPQFGLWKKLGSGRRLSSFELEITARCNNNCRHCYINLPANDVAAKNRELSFAQIEDIARQAVDLGAFGCLITGGEPLLREDFSDIYLCLKKKGLLVSVFTNATLINEKHITLFKKYPPRDLEVTVYGVTEKTYEEVTREQGSFKAFMRGFNLLLSHGIRMRLKTMALRSNLHELPQISEFCRQITKGFFRFNPVLHMRFDRNPARNREIKSERLLPEESVAIEQADHEHFDVLEKNCDKLIRSKAVHYKCNHLLRCGTGKTSFCVSYDGYFRLCSSLWHPDCLFDLKRGALTEAWEKFVPAVRDMRSDRKAFLTHCCMCPIINLCLWCPAHAYLETGELDKPIKYFCESAHARVRKLKRSTAGN